MAVVAIGRDKSSPQYAPWLVAIVFGFVIIRVGASHEPWFDEAQSWLLARDSALGDLLFRELRYEGSPGLWHALLWILTRIGFPYDRLFLVSAAIAWIGAALLLVRAPFPLILRGAFVFSYFFAYQYSVVARSYALSLLFFPLLADFDPGATRRPMLYCLALGLFANCNAQSFIVAAVLFLEFLALRPRKWSMVLASAVYVLFACAAVRQAWPAADGIFIHPGDIFVLRPSFQLSEAFIDRWDVLSATPPTTAARNFGLIASALVLIPSMRLFEQAGKLLLFLLASGGLILFSMVEYANDWHAGFIYLTWLLCLWRSWPAVAVQSPGWTRMLASSLALILTIQDADALAAWTREIHWPYSSAPAAARSIEAFRMAHPGAAIVGMGFKAFAVQPWFKQNVFANYNSGAEKPAYFAWRASNSFPAASDPGRWSDLLKSDGGLLVLSTSGLQAGAVNDMIASAHSAGYCLDQAEKGGLIWKTYVKETDDLLLFDRTSCGS